MFRFQKKKCTNEIMGKVIKKRWNGNIWFLTAEYIVEGKTYKRTEQLRYQKVKTHKIANVPIGMVSQAPLGNLKEGAVRRLTDEELNLLYEQIRQSSNEPVRVWE